MSFMSAKTGTNSGMISGSVLKIVAVVTMLIDHIAHGYLYRAFYLGHFLPGMDAQAAEEFYRLCRHIGRIAFPIYCFLLVEGFFHTRNRFRYAGALALFAAVSEIFFDLALTIWVNPEDFTPLLVLQQNPNTANGSQNVFWTLLIGLCVIWCMDITERLFMQGRGRKDSLHTLRLAMTSLSYVAIAFLGCYIADKFNTDYRYWGVLMIVLFYVLAKNRFAQAIVPYVLLCMVPFLFVEPPFLQDVFDAILRAIPVAWQERITPWATEVYAFPSFFLILLYNGKRGFLKSNPVLKYAFYAFYPLHLAAIYLVRILIL